MPRPKQEKTITKAIRLLHAGKSPREVAELCGVSLRTVQRWAQEREPDLQALKSQEKALVVSDPAVLSVTDIRAQVQEILDYRDSQRNFALEMGLVVQKATGVLLRAVENLEQNPDQITARTIPQLMRAVADASEKISNAWSRATGLDDLLEQVGGNEPIPGRYYLAGIDPNFGGRDYYNLLIWDITEKPYSLVFQYRNNCSSTTYNSSQSAIILNLFKPVVTVVEGNSGGKIVYERLIASCPSLAIESIWQSANSKVVHTDRLALAVESREVAYPPDWEGCSTWVDAEGMQHPSEMSQFSASERKALSGSDDAIMSWAAAFGYLQEALGEIQRQDRRRSAMSSVAVSVNPPQSTNLWG